MIWCSTAAPPPRATPPRSAERRVNQTTKTSGVQTVKLICVKMMIFLNISLTTYFAIFENLAKK